MKAARPEFSERRICQVFEVSRSAVRHNAAPAVMETPRRKVFDTDLVERIRGWVLKFPTFGYRRIWALLRFRDKLAVNKK